MQAIDLAGFVYVVIVDAILGDPRTLVYNYIHE
jgi:hypothetical protein